jgi:hypothetical protein
METKAEEPDEQVTIEFLDLAKHAHAGHAPMRAHHYGLIIDGMARTVHQHRMSAIAILDLVDKGPEEWVLEVVFHDGDVIKLSGDDTITFHERGIVEFRTERHPHHHEHETFKLTVVVNGDEVHPKVMPDTLLSVVVTEALELAHAVGRPEDQWELKTEAGVVLDQALTVEAAHIENCSILYLSLKAGAAGDTAMELLVDPAVSRAKFEADLAQYRAVEDGMLRRGQWLLKAEFPEVFVVYGALPAGPMHVVAFGALLDFTNYDLWPASVRIVHPFTRVPYKWSELPPAAALNRAVKIGEQPGPDGTAQEVLGLQSMMQSHTPDGIPFLCMRGVREYHTHPAHSGDDWLLTRASGEGTLYHLLDTLHRYGAGAIVGTQPFFNINPPRL